MNKKKDRLHFEMELDELVRHVDEAWGPPLLINGGWWFQSQKDILAYVDELEARIAEEDSMNDGHDKFLQEIEDIS